MSATYSNEPTRCTICGASHEPEMIIGTVDAYVMRGGATSTTGYVEAWPEGPCWICVAADGLGREHGHNAGSWIIDGNTTEETARRTLQGIADGDPEILDMMGTPLSGEWAGESIPELVDASGLDWAELDSEEMRDRNDVDTWCDAYEAGFAEAFWAEVERAARYVVGPCPHKGRATGRYGLRDAGCQLWAGHDGDHESTPEDGEVDA